MDNQVGRVLVGERGDAREGHAEDGDAAEEENVESDLRNLSNFVSVRPLENEVWDRNEIWER